MRQQFIPPHRTWVLTRSDCSPTTCAPPAVHDSTGKISTLLLDVKHTHTQYDSLTTQGTYQRSIIAQVTNDIEKGWKDMHSLREKISNSGTLKPVLRFPFGREGVENETDVLRFASFCELLRRPLTEDIVDSVLRCRSRPDACPLVRSEATTAS